MAEHERADAVITAEVCSWPGVEPGPGRRGELAFRVSGKEIGHLHGDRVAHFFFPKPLWRQLRADGRIEPHPVFPGREGPGARAIRGEEDARAVVELLRLNYERLASAAAGGG
jgi:Luciferase